MAGIRPSLLSNSPIMTWKVESPSLSLSFAQTHLRYATSGAGKQSREAGCTVVARPGFSYGHIAGVRLGFSDDGPAQPAHYQTTPAAMDLSKT